MKNMMKKTIAALAALVVMVSVVMPCGANDASGSFDDPFELWDDNSTRN